MPLRERDYDALTDQMHLRRELHDRGMSSAYIVIERDNAWMSYRCFVRVQVRNVLKDLVVMMDDSQLAAGLSFRGRASEIFNRLWCEGLIPYAED